MAASLLYKMCSKGKVPGVSVNPELFQEVYTSKYGKVCGGMSGQMGGLGCVWGDGRAGGQGQ
eukprot:365392-Chlamydomonas_euryale.AAC.6